MQGLSNRIDRARLGAELDAQGYSILPGLVAARACRELAALYEAPEQRPRMQSRPAVVPLRQGDAAVIAVLHRPVLGTRGAYRVNMRNGVSRVLRGSRYVAGIVFHDAA